MEKSVREPGDVSAPDGGDEGAYQAEMTFLEHLEELRWRILWSLGAVFLGTVIGFVLTQNLGVIDFLIMPVSQYVEGERLAYLSPTEPFFVTLKVAFLLGVILALPVIFYQFWAFVTPALLQREKRIFFPSIIASVVLFSFGILMAFGIVLETDDYHRGISEFRHAHFTRLRRRIRAPARGGAPILDWYPDAGFHEAEAASRVCGHLYIGRPPDPRRHSEHDPDGRPPHSPLRTEHPSLLPHCNPAEGE
jgi:hypothetical protein